MADITIPRGDKGFYLTFTIKYSDTTVFVLTGYTINFKVWPINSPGYLMVNGTCSIVVAANGTCNYLVVEGDFPTLGIYRCEIELTKAGAIESSRSYTIEVTDSG